MVHGSCFQSDIQIYRLMKQHSRLVILNLSSDSPLSLSFIAVNLFCRCQSNNHLILDFLIVSPQIALRENITHPQVQFSSMGGLALCAILQPYL